MQIRSSSITTKLLLLFLFVGLSSVLIVGSYSFYSAKKAIMQRTADQLISVRAVKKQQVEYFFSEKIRNLKSLSQSDILGRIVQRDLSGPEKSAVMQELDALAEYYRPYGFTNMYFVSGDRRPLRIVAANSTLLTEGRPDVVRHISRIVNGLNGGDSVCISDLFQKAAEDTLPVILIGCPVRTALPGRPGTVILEIPGSELNRIMLQNNRQIGLGNSGEAYLVGEDFLMRSTSRFIPGSVLKVPVRSATAASALQGATGASVTSDYRGVRVFSAYDRLNIPGLKWVVMAEIDYEEAMIPVTSLRNDILLVSLVISLFILGFARVITKMVTQPIIRLKNAAASIGEGNFDVKVSVDSTDEIGSLAETFNAMSDQIIAERRKRLLALFDGQEMERGRVSRELHDGLGQKLVGAKLLIENCDDDDPSCLRKTMNATKENLHSIVDELRRISNDLMPAALVELGLETALRNLCSDMKSQSGIDIDFDSDLKTVPGENLSVYLFRIAQEGLHNAVRHANAAAITVQLMENRDFHLFIIEDNGTGFDPGQTPKGNGLSNMRERAGLLGGTLTIESVPGNGTTLRVKIPKP